MTTEPILCKGMNCTSDGFQPHSIECELEHNANLFPGAGNKHPQARYKGYKHTGPILDINLPDSDIEKASWWEGFMAQASRAST